MEILLACVLLLVFAFWGLFIWAKADIPVIYREIAINTRKDESNNYNNYSSVKILNILYKIGAVLIWVLGIFIAKIIYTFGSGLLSMLSIGK